MLKLSVLTCLFFYLKDLELKLTGIGLDLDLLAGLCADKCTSDG